MGGARAARGGGGARARHFATIGPSMRVATERGSPARGIEVARRASRRAAVRAGASRPNAGESGKDKVYIGKGRFVQDDAKKYAGRDNWFTGGWPGGEKALKEVFIKEEFEAPTKGKAKQAMDLPDYAKGSDKLYVGKGKFVQGDAKQFAGRDNLFTGGWAGGEVGLKVGRQLQLKTGDLVRIKASGGFFGVGGKPERAGTVRKVNVKSNGDATIEVAVLPFDQVETVDAALCMQISVEEL